MADAVGDSIDRWRRLADEYGAIYRGGFAPNFVRMWPWGAIFVPFSLVPLWVAHALGVLLALVSRAMRRNPRPSRFGRA